MWICPSLKQFTRLTDAPVSIGLPSRLVMLVGFIEKLLLLVREWSLVTLFCAIFNCCK